MLELSFTVVNSNIFDQLDQECFFCCDERDEKTYFNEKKSILYIKGEAIRINIQDKVTNAHKILNHIFITNKDNLDDDFYYSEIAEDEFGDIEYKLNRRGWEKYRVTCRDIQSKIKDQTNNKIKNFLIFNTGKKG